MNKLDELKALMTPAQSQIPTNVTAREYDNLYQERKIVRYRLELMAVGVLPDLIAVAEGMAEITGTVHVNIDHA